MAQASKQNTILHLTDYGAPYAGNFIASLSALETLVIERGGNVVYVLPPRASERTWTHDFSQSHDVRFLRDGGFFSYYRQVRHFLRETNASILHEHFIHFSEKLAAYLASKTCGHRVRTVLHLHNHISLPKNPLLRLPHLLYFRSVSRFVCCSDSVCTHLIADGAPKARVYVAENAIAFERLDAFEPVDRASLGISAGERVALLFGFDFSRKGVDLAVEAVRSLREAGEHITLAVVLSSRREAVEGAILRQLQAQSLPGWIKLLPARSDVAAYYHLADVFLSPSREEGFCYSLVEAVYCKTPVLASAIDAQKDLALPPESFVLPGHAAVLADAIRSVLNAPDDPERRQALEAAKQRVVAAYSLRAWAERVKCVYSELLP